MTYVVPNMRLIPQSYSMACWYASAQMLVRWRRNYIQQSESNIIDPSEVPEAFNVQRANNGLPVSRMRILAIMVGLEPLPLMTPTPNFLEECFRQYGPLWCDGNSIDIRGTPSTLGHVVVLSGIRIRRNSYEIRIHDPAPVNIGNISWVPISYLSGILSDGANLDRDTFLLRLPRVIFSPLPPILPNELTRRVKLPIE